ncbi:NPCBM/NEW2 domain-containing protein [Thermostilla marina]
MRSVFTPVFALFLFGFAAQSITFGDDIVVPLGSLDLAPVRQGWGTPQVDRNVVGEPLRIAGRTFEYGVGTHADSIIRLHWNGQAKKFRAYCGIDDSAGSRGSVRFRIFVDGKPRFDSGLMHGGDAAKSVEIDLEDASSMLLWVTSGGDDIHFDHADWAEAHFVIKEGTVIECVAAPKEERVILTPKPAPEPRLNNPKVYGCRPGRPFLYRIPATGRRPIRFTAEGLPESLHLDPTSGIIRGKAPSTPGTYSVVFTAQNDVGTDHRSFDIVVGQTLALTPPMGWNHWYSWYGFVTESHIRRAADQMIASGMADFGYSYVNIDDGWMVNPKHPDPKRAGIPREPDGTLRSNGYFPDMAALADYVHAKGLKIGLYTSPGPTTCLGGYTGAYGHERQDAETFAAWGYDFLKYDWCSYGRVATGEGLERFQKPYRQMGEILVGLDRDIVYNLCQYGMGNVWEWAADVHGNCWRTTGDLGLARGGALPGFYHIGFANAEHYEYAKPGHWNDPDYILIGQVGDAHQKSPPKPTGLTPNEQYSYMSMWCLMAAPLIFSGDMEHLDEFTLNVLCNAEVIAVDQDPLGKQGKIIRRTDDEFVMVKPLEDGSAAVGLFNITEIPIEIGIDWSELGRSEPQRVRDLWRQKDLGVFPDGFRTEVPRHGVVLLRVEASR